MTRDAALTQLAKKTQLCAGLTTANAASQAYPIPNTQAADVCCDTRNSFSWKTAVIVAMIHPLSLHISWEDFAAFSSDASPQLP